MEQHAMQTCMHPYRHICKADRPALLHHNAQQAMSANLGCAVPSAIISYHAINHTSHTATAAPEAHAQAT